MSTCKRRGYTLIEVMVSSSLLLILLLGIYQVVSFGLRYWMVARAGETAHQGALVVLTRVGAELSQSSPSYVSMGLGPVAAPYPYVMFPSPVGTDSNFSYEDEELQWHKWVAFYQRGPDLLVAQIPFAPVVLPPNRPSLDSFVTSGTERIVARNVKSFSAVAGYPGLVRIEVTTQEPTASNKFSELTLSTQVRPGN